MAIQPSSGKSVPLYVFIIFVVLFLLSVVGLILLYVNQEELKTNAQQAKAVFEDYVGSRLKNSGKLEPYKSIGDASKPKKTAVEALLEERDKLARLLVGSSSAMSDEIISKLDAMIDSLPTGVGSVVKGQIKSNLIGGIELSVKILQNQQEQIAQLKKQIKELQQQSQAITQNYRELERKFQQRTNEFINQLKTLQRLIDSYKTQYANQLNIIKTQLGKKSQEKLAKLEKDFAKDIDEIRQMVRRNLQILIASTKETIGGVKFTQRLTPSKLTQQVDGMVLDVAGNIVYINLGKEHRVAPGLRFVVISPDQKDELYPKIKAVLEVIRTGKLTSECSVLKSIPGNPVIKGDLLINIAYDAQQTFTFIILGQIDANNDGFIDVNGVQQVMEMITKTGGKIVNAVTPTVDFVVMGKPMEKPRKPAPGAGREALKEYQLAMKRYQQFMERKDQIEALNIPIIPADILVKYLGYAKELN